jgi:hypothetical protein
MDEIKKILLFVVLVILVVPVLDVSLEVPAGQVGPPAPRVSIPALKHIKQQCSGSGSGSIHMFVGLSDPDPLVRGMDQDPSIIKQK